MPPRTTALVFAALISCAFAAESAKPNVIFILADDLGIGDVGCYGQEKIRTPNIDQLAKDGLRFTQHYCGCSVCAPSRCTLMTGKHTGHSAIRDNAQRGPSEEGQRPMPASTQTVAQILQNAGYYTGIIGKWGLGMPEDHSSPRDFGFNYSYGYLCQSMAHTYYPPYLWRNNERESLPGNPLYDVSMKGVIEPKGELYSHDLMANDALKFVRDHRAAPFFLYLAFTIPHVSLQVPEDSMAEYHGKWTETPFTNTKHYANNDTPRAAYAGMITRMDHDIGRLMAVLKELGLEENTLVFFSSDNGAVFPLAGTDPVFFQSTAGFRGYKQDLYEGGIRTPLIARWPGKIKAGATTDNVSVFYDFLPTMAEFAGAPAPAGTDGVSFLPTLLGQAGQKQHDFLYWEYQSSGGRVAVRMGDWKVVRNNVKKDPNSPYELYNLATDRTEAHDVAADHPELIAKAKEIIAREHAESGQGMESFPGRPAEILSAVSDELFLTLRSHPTPGFVCRAAGRGRENERFTARVTHDVRGPASPADLDRLRGMVPASAKELLGFYALHDGMVLYRDTRSLSFGQLSIQAAGVELYRVADMAAKTASLRELLEMPGGGDDPNDLQNAIAIGESPHSGNYFAMTTKGAQPGRVFFVDHDDWQEGPFADSFGQFLDRICTAPAELLAKTLGCTARYSDGRTNTQWIPLEYVPDVGDE